MSAEVLINRIWKILIMVMALGGLALGYWPMGAPAQGKKEDPQKKEEPPKKNEPGKKVVTPKGPTINDIMVNTAGGLEQVTYINEMLTKMWADNKVRPSDRCTDYEFIRRASLDIIGRIARVDELKTFLDDPPERRRSLLIERLLNSSDYANNWANLWTVMLLTRSGSTETSKEQLESWFVEKLTEKKDSKDSKKLVYVPDWSKIVTELLTATGRTNENGAVNYLLHHLGEANPGTEWGANGKFDFVPVTSRTTRLFLGLRTQCVQCHDHPFNSEWGQHHFWGVNAFFRQADPSGRPTTMVKKKVKGAPEQQFTLTDNKNLNSKGIVPYERRSGVLLFTDATFLDGKKMPKTSANPRRQELANFIVKSPYFSKVSVNRMWAHFFGRSFTKDAPDDFGEHNPASNQELLDRLADDWANKYNHDPKALIRWICNSKAYGLSSIANETNDKPEDEVLFARMILKALSPEQLFESLMVATMAQVGQSKDSRKSLREDWLRKLVVNFGDDEGNELSFNGTVVQALMLMNGQDINQAIMDRENGTVAAVLKKRAFSRNAAVEAMRDLYLAGLNRPPTKGEVDRMLNNKMITLPKSAPPKTPQQMEAFWTGFYQDMFWAILNSNEFILNH